MTETLKQLKREGKFYLLPYKVTNIEKNPVYITNLKKGISKHFISYTTLGLRKGEI